MGKNEIVNRARKIGTFDCSIQPHDDCCSFLMPKEPATRSTAEELDTAEADLDIEDLVEKTWANREVERVTY